MLVKIGSFAKPDNTTGNQSITDVGFTPKLVIFFGNSRTSDGSHAGARLFFGATDGTHQVSQGCQSTDNAATSAGDKLWTSTHCITHIIDGTPTVSGQAAITSFDADVGFTINWHTCDATQWIVNYIALGGADISAFVGSFTAPVAVDNTFDVTGVGFKPTGMILIEDNLTTTPTADNTAAASMVHALSFIQGSTKRNFARFIDQDAQATINTKGHQRTDLVHVTVSGAGLANIRVADFVSFDNDGFTLNFSTIAGASATLMGFICIAGVQVDVGAFNQAVTPNTGTQAITGTGFQPKLVLLQSFNAAATTNVVDGVNHCFGAAISATERAAVWLGDTDNVADSISDSVLDRANCLISYAEGTPTLVTQADFVSMDPNGFTITNDNVDATARQVLYFAIGDGNLAVSVYDSVAATENFAYSIEGGIAAISVSVYDSVAITENVAEVEFLYLLVVSVYDPIAATESVVDSLSGLNVVVTGSAAGWLAGGWDHRVKITIDQTKVDATLTNFPILVKLSTSSGLSTKDLTAIFTEINADANRKKIAVTEADGTTQLYVEVASWDTANKAAYLWVKIPSVSGSVDTDIYLYYDKDVGDNTTYVGDPNSTPAETVWSNGYEAVYHFAETAGNYYDSTANNHDVTTIVVTTRTATGKVGVCPEFVPATTDRMNANYAGLSGDMTLEVWAYQHNAASYRTIVQHAAVLETEPDNILYSIESDVNSYLFEQWEYGAGTNTALATTNAITLNEWQYLASVRDNTARTVDWFVNTAKLTQSTYTAGQIPTGGANGLLYIGGRITTAYYYDGLIDELRISSEKRADEWLKAAYYTGMDQLVTFGDVEVPSAAEGISITEYCTLTSFDFSTIPLSVADDVSVSEVAQFTEINWLLALSVSDAVAVTENVAGVVDPLNVLVAGAGTGWLTGWLKRIKLTIDHTIGNETLTDFPLMLHLSTDTGIGGLDVSAIFDELNADVNRKKIAITTADGTTQCYAEIVRWDDANEQAYLFVKIPSISGTADTDLYFYFDSTHADNDAYVGDKRSAPGEAVWSDYQAVYHLEETTGAYLDSTANHNDSTLIRATSRDTIVAGAIGGYCFEGDDVPQTGLVTTIGIPSSVSLNWGTNPFTVMVRIQAASGHDLIDSDLSRKGSTGNDTNSWWKMEWGDGTNNQRQYMIRVAGTDYISTSIIAPDSLWHNQAMVRKTSDTTLLSVFDGAQVTSRGASNGSVSCSSNLSIGSKDTNDDDPFDGYIDEWRAALVERSLNWLSVEFHGDEDELITFDPTVENQTGAEQVAVTEAVSLVLAHQVVVYDLVALTENLAINLTVLNSSVYDPISLTENGSTLLSVLNYVVFDSIGIAEYEYMLGLSLEFSIYDGVAVSESVYYALGFLSASVVDSKSIAEYVSLFDLLEVSVG